MVVLLMKIAMALVVVVLALAACDPAPGSAAGDPEPSPSMTERIDTSREAQIYAAVIRRLVTKDGYGPPSFRHIYVVDGPVPKAGSVWTGLRPADEAFSESLRKAMVRRLADLPPIDFIGDPNRLRLGRAGGGGVKNKGVIITLAPIAPGPGELKVGTGLWCGGDCGQWLTYVVRAEGEGWRIIGTAGTATVA